MNNKSYNTGFLHSGPSMYIKLTMKRSPSNSSIFIQSLASLLTLPMSYNVGGRVMQTSVHNELGWGLQNSFHVPPNSYYTVANLNHHGLRQDSNQSLGGWSPCSSLPIPRTIQMPILCSDWQIKQRGGKKMFKDAAKRWEFLWELILRERERGFFILVIYCLNVALKLLKSQKLSYPQKAQNSQLCPPHYSVGIAATPT